jgi:hypothetical protein
MTLRHYVLDELKRAVPASVEEWGRFLGNMRLRRVGQNQVPGGVLSTAFIGLDYSFGDGEPEVFETALLEHGGVVHVLWRGATWQQAEMAHARELRRLQADKVRTAADGGVSNV